MWQIQVMQSYYLLFTTNDVKETQEIPLASVVASTAGITLLSSGIVLTYLRLKEPLF